MEITENVAFINTFIIWILDGVGEKCKNNLFLQTFIEFFNENTHFLYCKNLKLFSFILFGQYKLKFFPSSKSERHWNIKREFFGLCICGLDLRLWVALSEACTG